MKSISFQSYIVKIAITCANDKGEQEKQKQTIVVDALSFAEAEKKAIEYGTPYSSDGVEVKGVKPSNFGEVIFTGEDADDKYYLATLDFITINERTEKETKSKVRYLVQASSVEGATKNVKALLNGTMIDYVIDKVQSTKIMDVVTEKGTK